MAKYNGHKNWNHWNVSLWINNDEPLYRIAYCACLGNPKYLAAELILAVLHDMGITHTPDGAKYSVSSIRSAISDIAQG